MRPEFDRLADVLVGLLESGSPAVVLGCLAPGAVLWHNSDKHEGDAATGMLAVAGLHGLVAQVRVEVVERAELPDGFLQRFVLRGVVKDSGAPLAAHQCILVRVDGTLITRIDEYVDPTFGAQLGVPREEVRT